MPSLVSYELSVRNSNPLTPDPTRDWRLCAVEPTALHARLQAGRSAMKLSAGAPPWASQAKAAVGSRDADQPRLTLSTFRCGVSRPRTSNFATTAAPHRCGLER